jgi:[ribosomal protein S5]-alanine N-acetyltransferase
VIAPAPITLSTARLTLRKPAPDDAQAIFDAYSSDPEVTRFLSWPTHEHVDRAHAFLQRCEAVWRDAKAFPWAITLGRSIIGMIEARIDGHRAEIGYALGRKQWGRGYASEAARAVVAWALAQPTVSRVWAYVDTANVASARVLEHTGMTREGVVRAWYAPPALDGPRDCFMYARLREPRARFAATANSLSMAITEAEPPAARPVARDAERIETAQLVLRRATLDDATAIFVTYAQDPAVSRYTTWRPHRGVSDTREFLRSVHAGWERGTVFGWAITVRETGRLLGVIDIRLDAPRAEIGYVLARPDWGKGYATEAASAVTAWGLAQPAIHRVWAVCDVDNVASARVLEKAGMTREARLGAWASLPAFETPRDVWCYAVTRKGA